MDIKLSILSIPQLHLIAGVGIVLLIVALLLHNIARANVDAVKIAKYPENQRKIRGFWVTKSTVRDEAGKIVLVRNFCAISGFVILIVGGIIQDYFNR